MSKGTSEEWRALQQRYATAADKRGAFYSDKRFKYGDGSTAYYSAAERKQWEKLRNSEDRAMDRIMAWLDKHGSPRNWHITLPCNFICRELTFESATTLDAIEQDAPPAYGYTDADVARFLAPLRVAA